MRIRPSGNKRLSITVWNLGADSQNISAVCYIIGVTVDVRNVLKGYTNFWSFTSCFKKLAATFVQKVIENANIIER